jgi:predicted MFS family arabinose efflux permease
MMAGAANVSMVGLADEHGRPGLAGAILGLWAFGSLVAGAVAGSVRWRSSAARRLRWWASWMTIVMVTLAFVSDLAVSMVLLCLAGMALAPYFTAMTTVITETVPLARLTEGMALTNMGMIMGVAPGTAVCGWVLERWGVYPTFLVCASIGAVGAVTASVLIRSLSTTARQGAAARVGVAVPYT